MIFDFLNNLLIKVQQYWHWKIIYLLNKLNLIINNSIQIILKKTTNSNIKKYFVNFTHLLKEINFINFINFF